jgi:hypothetical protein
MVVKVGRENVKAVKIRNFGKSPFGSKALKVVTVGNLLTFTQSYGCSTGFYQLILLPYGLL